jgi:hypothetical protein
LAATRIPPVVVVNGRWSAIIPEVTDVAPAGTVIRARVIEFAGAPGAAGDGAADPVMILTCPVDAEVPVSLTAATTMSIRGLVGSAVATVRVARLARVDT